MNLKFNIEIYFKVFVNFCLKMGVKVLNISLFCMILFIKNRYK